MTVVPLPERRERLVERGDGVHAATVIAIAQEQGFRRFENGFAFGWVFRPAGAVGR